MLAWKRVLLKLPYTIHVPNCNQWEKKQTARTCETSPVCCRDALEIDDQSTSLRRRMRRGKKKRSMHAFGFPSFKGLRVCTEHLAVMPPSST